jgi:hypothetical protein
MKTEVIFYTAVAAAILLQVVILGINALTCVTIPMTLFLSLHVLEVWKVR